MLISTVVMPESFLADHFANPTYRLNMEEFLKALMSNGLILVDAEKRLYQQICDNVELLANHPKGKNAHAFFEELLKKQREEKIIRFVYTACSFNSSHRLSDIAVSVATRCKADSLLTDTETQPQLANATNGFVPVIPIADYTNSEVEAERRKAMEGLPSLDQMTTGQFDKLIAGATKYSRWLRFYDKQIGKGTGLGRFKRGMERIVNVWIKAAHFSKSELSIEVYTVADDSLNRRSEPSVAYHRVKSDLVDALQQQFSIPVRLSVKCDTDKICHDRYLQTQSLSIMFAKGFDIIEDSGALCHSFMTAGGNFTNHLNLYRKLPEYQPTQAN
jgi:hypothetical protein